jgi:hypothetical protein
MTVNLNSSHQASRLPLMGRSVFFYQALLDFIQLQANCLASIFSTGRILILLLTRKINLSYQNETTP